MQRRTLLKGILCLTIVGLCVGPLGLISGADNGINGSSKYERPTIKSYIGVYGRLAYLVESVHPGSPAALAGIKPNNLISHVNGQPIHAFNDLRQTILKTREALTLTYKTFEPFNEGQELTATVMPIAPPSKNPYIGLIGALVFVVDDVKAGFPAEAAGIKRGDMFTKLNGFTFASVYEFQQSIVSREPGTTINVEYRRYSSENRTFAPSSISVQTKPANPKSKSKVQTLSTIQEEPCGDLMNCCDYCNIPRTACLYESAGTGMRCDSHNPCTVSFCA